jgi:hypothetical protein
MFTTDSTALRSQALLSWLDSYSCELVNEPDILTWIRPGSAGSVIDLSFATQRLYTEISEWYIDELNATGSDYELIRINIRTQATELVDNFLCSAYFNL